MADQINVTDSRSRSPWPWIIGIIVILIAIWAFTQMGDTTTDEVNINVPAPAEPATPAAPAGDSGNNAGGDTTNP
ncbi:MAG: hypothetical protein EPO30_01175 [Lysobacteraceae bacterium]|nr:MAG: hypothetical protein EPO30_01175 [Xanthomonadaceae bacterium]